MMRRFSELKCFVYSGDTFDGQDIPRITTGFMCPKSIFGQDIADDEDSDDKAQEKVILQECQAMRQYLDAKDDHDKQIQYTGYLNAKAATDKHFLDWDGNKMLFFDLNGFN